jgi:fibronectin type 3 domain-containing protein
MSLPAPATLNLTQDGPTVDIVWSAVSGADYYIVWRYISGGANLSEIVQTTSTSWTDYAVPIVVESGGNYVAATWRYRVAAVDGTGIGSSIDSPITMSQVTVADIQGADLSKPILADGTQYDYDQISFGSTASRTQEENDSVLIAYLKTIET